jgi:hypothetical protein
VPLSSEIPEIPLAINLATGWYFRREGRGVLMAGAKDSHSSFDTRVDWAGYPRIAEVATHRMPALIQARFGSHAWAGLYVAVNLAGDAAHHGCEREVRMQTLRDAAMVVTGASAASALDWRRGLPPKESASTHEPAPPSSQWSIACSMLEMGCSSDVARVLLVAS